MRLAFCAALPGVCAFIGQMFTCNFIYPCMENALVDVELMVVVKAIEVVSELIRLELLTPSLIDKVIGLVGCLVLHPCKAVREQAISMIVITHDTLGAEESRLILNPIMEHLLQYDVFGGNLTTDTLRSAVLSPVSSKSFGIALKAKRNQLHAGSDVSAMSAEFSKSVVRIDDPTTTQPPTTASIILESAVLPPFPPSSDHSKIIDEHKISLMSAYIDQAAYEMNTKTLQWRNGQSGVTEPAIRVPYQYMIENRSVIDDLLQDGINSNRPLDIPDSLLPESAMHSLKIPHQKLSVGIGISRDLRNFANNFQVLAEDPNLITKVYGIKKSDILEGNATGYNDTDQASSDATVSNVSSSDMGLIIQGTSIAASRPMSFAVKQLPRKNNLAFRNRSTTLNNTIASLSIVESPETSDINSSPFVANALSDLSGTDVVLRQIKALNIPPLPRDLGSLRQPDGREYSMFVEQLDMSLAIDPQSRASWRPKDTVQLASLTEHSQVLQ